MTHDDLLAAPVEERTALLAGLAGDPTEENLALLREAARSPDDELAQAAIATLAKIPQSAAADILLELGQDRRNKERAKAARRALYRLRLAGIIPSVLPTPTPRPPAPDNVYACLVSYPDYMGTITVMVVRQNRFGTLRLASFLGDDEGGIRSVGGRDPCSMSEWKRIQKQMAAEPSTRFVPVELALARRVVDTARARNDRTGIRPPSEFPYWRGLLEGPSEERPRPPELDPQAVRAEPRFLAESDRLIDALPSGAWLLPLNDVAKYAERMQTVRNQFSKQSEELPVLDLSIVQAEGTVVSMAIRELFDGARTARLADRLQLAADLFWREGRMEEACRAVATALALAEGGDALENIPFIRELARLSIETALRTMEPTEANNRPVEQAPGLVVPRGTSGGEDKERQEAPGFVRRSSGLIVPKT